MKKIIASILTVGFCASFLSACIVETSGPRHGYYRHDRGYHRGYYRGY